MTRKKGGYLRTGQTQTKKQKLYFFQIFYCLLLFVMDYIQHANKYKNEITISQLD